MDRARFIFLANKHKDKKEKEKKKPDTAILKPVSFGAVAHATFLERSLPPGDRD